MQVTNSLGATRDVINEGEVVIRQARRDAEEAQARAEAAERALESVRTDRADEIKRAENRVETEANRLWAALSQLTKAESAVEAGNLHIAELNSAIQAAEDKARRAEEEAEHTKEAERTAASRVAKMEAKVAEVEAAAEARAVAAVEEFRASKRFADELVEANADAYVQGFRDAKEKVTRVLDLPGVMDIEPDQGSEGAPPDDEPTANP